MTDWEPFGEEGRGGYTWGRKSDGSMGFVPGGVGDPTDIMTGVDVGGMTHVAYLPGTPVQMREFEASGRYWWKCTDCGQSSSVMDEVPAIEAGRAHWELHSAAPVTYAVTVTCRAIDERAIRTFLGSLTGHSRVLDHTVRRLEPDVALAHDEMDEGKQRGSDGQPA